MSPSEKRRSEAFRARVRELLALGYSVSAIAKATSATYSHTKQIADQEREAVELEESR